MNYKAHITDVFNRSAADYGGFGTHYFDIFAKRLHERAKGFPGACILDAATGRGAILKHALKCVGKEGKAVGIDISSAMIEETRKEIREENAVLYCMDAEALDFEDGTFDIVYCGFALFFFEDRKQAMSEFKRVLKPGGKLAISTWGEIDVPRRLLKNKIISLGVDPRVYPHPMPDEEELRELFHISGFSSLEIVPDWLDHTYANFDHWWECLSLRASRSTLEKLTEEQRQTLKQELSVELEEQSRPDGFHEEFHVYYVTGNK
ncbi:MAG: class I SAM-dependent methyltransferase [Verrucomicrobia bacterium]|nr:class I SAM-dependent methyltransferase [Verrucomicrobiota bacterium]